MKKLILLLIFLPLIVLAVGECPRFGIIQVDIPCVQPSSWNPGTCAGNNATLFNSSGDIVLTASYYNYPPYCAFNVTGLEDAGTYCYNSTINDGCITLQAEDNMLSIILVQIGLVIFLILLGLPHKFGFTKFLSWGLAALEILITVWMVYIKEAGGSITQLLYINAISILIIGGYLSIITIFMLMGKMMTWQGKKINDDSWTKFIFDTK